MSQPSPEPVPGPDTEAPEPKERMAHPFRSLKELVDFVSGRTVAPAPAEESGLAEPLPFPFLAIVGQQEMKLALLLGLVNPSIGGILLVGPRGTAKTTAVRSLLDILPKVERSLCRYGCLPEDVETGGVDAVCPDCARKYAEGQPLTAPDRARLVELPLNARLEDVVGGIVEEQPASHERSRVRRGILAQADRNLLYIDEINLLADEIVDAILDAAAQGSYTVRRGPASATYRARFVLIGSMNPEEGKLRPQILDRFGLRVLVRGLERPAERLEAYRRVHAYLASPRAVTAAYADEMLAAAQEVQSARERLPKVTIPDNVAKPAIKLVQKMGIDSLRAEITWFEAARAYAAADGRTTVAPADLKTVAPMALRLRRSQFMTEYFSNQKGEEEEMEKLLNGLGAKQGTRKK
ncbi:MAG: magnesium chelatase subunit I [Anaerolineaceae bacterium]|nr:MAG: magnesium chelatase subunit I [Anaerolineaceae bacterium]